MEKKSHRVLDPSCYQKQAWRNGLGSTTELLANRPDPSSFDWRISMAPVTSNGLFSDFSGYDRTLVLLEGQGLLLRHQDHGEQRLGQPLDLARFSGDWKTEGILLNGPIHDFNIMTRRGHWSAEVETGPLIGLENGPGLHLIYAPSAPVDISDDFGEQVLETHHLLIRAPGGGYMHTNGAPLIWVVLTQA